MREYKPSSPCTRRSRLTNLKTFVMGAVRHDMLLTEYFDRRFNVLYWSGVRRKADLEPSELLSRGKRNEIP